MLNLRYIFRLIGAFLSRFRALIFISVGFGVLFFFLLRFLIPNITFKEHVRIGLTGKHSVSNLPVSVLNLIGNGLTRMDTDGSVVPDIASSWETTDKGKTWIFTLRSGVFWQDGTEVISKDINYQFSDVSIERPDDRTIIFKLDNAYSAFPAVVSKPAFKSGLLGTGKYKVTKVSFNGSAVEEINLSSEDGTKTTYKFYPTEERTKTAFKLGQVDKIEDLYTISPFDTWSKAKIDKITDKGEFVAIFFNTQDNILSEKDIRQALTYAIDKTKLGSERAISPISEDSWAYNPQVKPYDYDAKKALEMIENYKEVSKTSEISIVLSTSPILLDKAELIAEDWEKVGIKTNIQVVSATPADYQALLVIYDVPEDPDQYSIWHSTQKGTNITRYENVRIDKLLEDGRSEINLQERRKIYMDFQRFLVEDCPTAFLYYPSTFTVSRN